ncbi:uncharacterized protein LOC120634100 [Pararge aegeria]|uniref:uncharacterized protein LOC120634100 n=1 Tax=Pararge aegeria TaxID=116150 RepID=UPI0019D315D4|nr:uncharacterized protein LOC120634100 [Pararge aegeria]
MKSFSATALSVFAVLTVCLAAKDRSRQRSGPIRSVPVAASLKRDVDFDCPEEFGYYPHPTDCTLYYVCVFGGALLESCTGGLMYSHELQTCDWPRNVGCDATGAVVAEDLERINEREPPPPPPRRNPPPPPRAQPNPVITSRGQPKFNRQEYEKQQLYAEVDDLPPVEEIESDRQQRVYRGQPSTIGQVQKDRDGYVSQTNSGRTFNSNIIPSSINQNSKIGSFSFGTQVDERRTATVTQAPQTYRVEKYDDVTDSIDRPKDFLTDISKVKDITQNTLSRKKRDIVVNSGNSSVTPDKISKRNDNGNDNENENENENENDEVMEYIEFDEQSNEDEYNEEDLEDSERGKRQIRFYLKNGFRSPDKNWPNPKPQKLIHLHQYNLNPNLQNQRLVHNIEQNPNNRKPLLNSNFFSSANSYVPYNMDNIQNRPFKASIPDPINQKSPQFNGGTQIITKSPPISSLNNNQNPYSAFAGGFYNNALNIKNNQLITVHSTKQPNSVSPSDSSYLSSSIVTGKPIQTTNSVLTVNNYRENKVNNNNPASQSSFNGGNKQVNNNGPDYEEDEDVESSDEEESSQEEENDDDNQNVPVKSYGYNDPGHKFAKIENPFANPEFNFDTFLEKLRDDHYSIIGVTTPNPNTKDELNPPKIASNHPLYATASYTDINLLSSTLKNGLNTPRPFTVSAEVSSTAGPSQRLVSSTPKQVQKYQHQLLQRPETVPQNYIQNTREQPPNHFNKQLTPVNQGEIFRPNIASHIKPPNFKDDRQLPLSYSFNAPNENTLQQPYAVRPLTYSHTTPMVTQKPYLIGQGTAPPTGFLMPKNHKQVTPQPQLSSSTISNFLSNVQSQNVNPFLAFIQSTPKPTSTLVDEQLSALHNYWKTLTTGVTIPTTFVLKQGTVTETPKQGNSYYRTLQSSTQLPIKSKNRILTTSTTVPPKRRPIPKPSPEMNDYYYDEEDEQYYYEPAVKPKYMPSSEVKPQRPAMAQNYKEYDDIRSSENTKIGNSSPKQANNLFKQDSVTKNHNDLSVVTKIPYKQQVKSPNGKIPVPVMVDYVNTANNQYVYRNKTVHLRKPNHNPNTLRPPKYLNQTTLRPYTVRHRLAKPTTEKYHISNGDYNKKTRERVRHQNIVAQNMKYTTPRDSFKQETRFTKTSHDDRINSLEPTESITPTSYSASPRPKMLYNGSQTYSADQYDPYYAVYDEDGELYKDTDYVQQYNQASLRPAVQQTYRGTPPPARRPVETYTPRPVSPDDYDDVLLQPQISNQNQYQSSIRQQTRGDGNELGYDHIPSSVRTTVYEASSQRTTPSTTSTSTTTSTTTTTTTTTRRPTTTAPYTEAMTSVRYSPRPSSTRGRGSAHFSTSGGSESSPQTSNRGTPPTRSRPTLKPSTAIVSKTAEIPDIYLNPPRRPESVYPQPTPDKTAAKCRKDVCLLPDCFCGGKDIPGDLPVDKVPQIVLLTYDDSVNDLNKGLYADLFEKGRVNPNGCPISATFYVSHEWTDYSQVQNLYSAGHEMASHTVSHSFGEQFSQKKWNREVGGQREILAAYGGVKLEDVRGMRAPFLSVGGNKMFKMLYDSNFTYDSSLPVYENKPPSWPYTLDYKLFHDCMIPPCPTKSYPGVWEVPMVMWQDLNGGRCSMGDACANPPDSDGVYKMILKNFDRHYTSNRAPFGLFYHAAWFTQPHHKEGFIKFLDFINKMPDVWIVTNWQALQWVRDPTPISRLNNFQPFQCNYADRPKKCNNAKVCNLWHKSGVRYMRTCQPCPEIYPWTGKTGIRSSKIDHEIEE